MTAPEPVPSGDDGRPVDREYLNLRLRAEFAELRAEMADRFAGVDRRLVVVNAPVWAGLVAIFVVVLVR